MELIDSFENLRNREFEFSSQEKYISVKGKSKQNQSFWENNIKANDTVLNIIQEGYRLPFLETPDTARFGNNKSAINNFEFIENSIKEKMATGTIAERNHSPPSPPPLELLNLCHMNLYKDKIKLDDWKCFENYLPANKRYLFKFDLKNGYHHIDIFNSYPTYLDFSWNINGSTKHFVFNVLPFCLSSALFVFRKVVHHE